MRDVADLVGVSLQTVSAVINDKPGISDDTRARVLEAIRQLGYRPYSVARSLRTRQTRTLALIVSDIANPSFATMASAAENYAHQYGYSLIVYNTHDDIERESSYVRTVAQRWIDGVLFVSAADSMPNLVAFQAAGTPTVAIDRIPEDYDGPSVTLDNIQAGRLAAEHLIALGHTHLATITGPLRLHIVRERRAGFVQTIESHGLSVSECAMAEGDWTCSSGAEAMTRILDSYPQVTAVFCANDRMAIGAMRAIKSAGLRVPEDISVLGIDDIEVAAFQMPSLTTLRQSFAELGTRAVELLLEIIETRQQQSSRIIITPILIKRDSTCPVPVQI
ncbi:LacI family DNA-binding transcriptional regulator [Aggregatilinea lenta]|uniref:LacI family DNA-binding transcriptional regulator n=1 Tax=Aggregatilinea lenta TaxID=913108 RepID=UPI0013C3276D|nr:LacI family DNA-binding transcriptional regulator [Aggregatilinea lenta]